MAADARTEMLHQLETAPITARHRLIVLVSALALGLEFFDYFLIGYILTIVARPWHLTYAQSAFVLLTSGIGATVGAICVGRLADRNGRRPWFLATILVFSVGSGAMALLPDGSWLLLGLFRLAVGFGVGGLTAVVIPLAQEFVPTRCRGLVGGLIQWLTPVGILGGGLCAAALGPTIGWRGLALIGLVPCLLVLAIVRHVPESPTWLLRKGRSHEARTATSFILGIPVQDVGEPPPDLAPAPATRWQDLLRFPRSVTSSWLTNIGIQTATYGILLWGPTLTALTMDVTPARAATIFTAVVLSGLAGRIAASFLAERFGPKTCGTWLSAGATVALALTALSYSGSAAGGTLFVVAMSIAFFFVDSGWAFLNPYAGQVFPAELRASGIGAAYGIGGIGKIVGGAGLALISGAGSVANPQATVGALRGGFILFAACAALAVIGYAVFGIDTRKQSTAQQTPRTAKQWPSRRGPGRAA